MSENGIIDPVSPGELLKEEFLEPLGISQYRLAKEIGVPAQRIGQITCRTILPAGTASPCPIEGSGWPLGPFRQQLVEQFVLLGYVRVE